MNRYIIKNCPAFNQFTKQCKGIYSKDINHQYCSGNENCLLKQIVELCKEEQKPIKTIDKGDYMEILYQPTSRFASKILDLLEIEEVR